MTVQTIAPWWWIEVLTKWHGRMPRPTIRFLSSALGDNHLLYLPCPLIFSSRSFCPFLCNGIADMLMRVVYSFDFIRRYFKVRREGLSRGNGRHQSVTCSEQTNGKGRKARRSHQVLLHCFPFFSTHCMLWLPQHAAACCAHRLKPP